MYLAIIGWFDRRDARLPHKAHKAYARGDSTARFDEIVAINVAIHRGITRVCRYVTDLLREILRAMRYRKQGAAMYQAAARTKASRAV